MDVETTLNKLNNQYTFKVKLVASMPTFGGYTYYVFENLEYTNIDFHYFTTVRLPRWDHVDINVGDVGYVCLKYVREGEDTWFDGTQFIAYKNTNLIFLRFIAEKPSVDIGDIKLD